MTNNTQYKNFEEFFCKATGKSPYPYQKRLAESNTIYSAINIPTGTGKTEAAILGLWLWKRLNKENVPRRLIYCLPMRVLAEQTQKRVKEWLKNIGLENTIHVELLLGGSDTKIQNILSDKEYVIIGTQDMLISGALNHAYGNSPYVWPIVFGLLNNDSMWIMDEVQIMENALPTSIQLDHFRNKFGTYGPHKTVWMSATLNPDWLKTVDSNKDKSIFTLNKETDIDESLKKRNGASKTLQKTTIVIKKEYSKEDAAKILKLHQPNTTTAIIVNTVKRAQKLYSILSLQNANCKLIHSRFRGKDRSELNEWLSKFEGSKDQIIISTQVIEAGVDMSVKTMITEIAPWASLVQRFGRCNRKGEFDNANIYWIDLDKNISPPYDERELEYAKSKLDEMTGKSISPQDLPEIVEPKLFDAVLRTQDMINLFDTTPDLSGNHIDVSRFVRNMKQQLDIDVFWRDIPDVKDVKDQPRPERDEMCSVSIGELGEFFGKKNKSDKKNKSGYIWNYAEGIWEKKYKNDLLPGQTIMLDSKTSGYSKTYGWYQEEDKPVDVIVKSKQVPESHDDDQKSKLKIPVTLGDHTKHVLAEVESFLENFIYIDDDIKNTVRTAVKYHDIGKAHMVFQEAMNRGIESSLKKSNDIIWAKSQNDVRYKRPGFRHEVVSSLAYMKQKDERDNKLKDLVAYIIMSHHGKARLSLRSISKKHSSGNTKYLLGVDMKKDILSKFSSGDISIKEDVPIDMSQANIGRTKDGDPSWTEIALGLRDRYGSFCLAYLETLIRRADWLASEKEGDGKY